MKFATTQLPNFYCLIAIAFYTADDRMAGDLPRRQLRKSECAERVWVADSVCVGRWFCVCGSLILYGRILKFQSLNWSRLDLSDLFYMVAEI